VGAGCVALSLSTALAVGWPTGTLDGIIVEGLGRHPSQLLFLWVWFYCILCWFVQDFLKVIAWKILFYYNVCGITDIVTVKKDDKIYQKV